MSDTKSITTLVLCGGLGTRLRSVTGDVPKVLASVAGHPFIYYVVRYLKEQGFRDIVLCTGYGAADVEAYCKNGSQWGVSIRYSPEAVPLGTGGAVKLAEPLIASSSFLVLNGDSIVQADLSRLVAVHERNNARITMALTEVPDKSRFGSVQLSVTGEITAFMEKGQTGIGFINAGVYMINRSVLNGLASGEKISIEQDVFPKFVSNGLYGVPITGLFIDIGIPESYQVAQTMLANWGN